MSILISILLATYNGEKYIAEQIESLLSQTVQDFRLFIRDDRSTDSTYPIVMEYAEKYSGKIFAAQNKENTGGAKFNFMRMMIEHKDDYIMLCDQDDIWLPNKIEKTLDALKHTEGIYGKDTPIIFHSDLMVVDGDLNVISPSYRKSASCNFDNVTLNHMLTQNIVTGATACYNKALGDLIRKPEFMMMHDMWIAMVAAAFGHIVHSDEALMLYRQHGGNEVGAKNIKSLSYILQRLLHAKQTKARLEETYTQAGAFLIAYSDMLSTEHKALISEYCRIPQMTKLCRISTLIRLKALRNPKLGHILFV